MLNIILGIILTPIALAAVGLTIAIGIGIIKGIAAAFKHR